MGLDTNSSLNQFTRNLSTHTRHFIHNFNILKQSLKCWNIKLHVNFSKPTCSIFFYIIIRVSRNRLPVKNTPRSTYTYSNVMCGHVTPPRIGGRGVYVSSSIMDERTLVKTSPSVQDRRPVQLCIPSRASYIQMLYNGLAMYQVKSWVHL